MLQRKNIYLKIDTQGFEAQVLRGGGEAWIAIRRFR
ncbi:FkbM family methyltransferase [Variovorax sp. dw_308]